MAEAEIDAVCCDSLTQPSWGEALIKHQASSVAPLAMCSQLRAPSDHSRGFVQTQRTKVTETESGDKETVEEDCQVLHKMLR